MKRACVSSCLVGLLLGALSARAADFYAPFHHDAPDCNPGDGVCSDNPYVTSCTLRAAIQEANALPGLDTIYLSAGTYDLSIAGTDEDYCATGDLDINDHLRIIGAGADQTLINANLIDRVFHARDPSSIGTIVAFTGFTIVGGAINGNGGGILADGPYVVGMSDCVVRSNVALSSGGGLYIQKPASSPHIVGVQVLRCTFEFNTANFGGAVSGSGDYFSADRSTFAHNYGPQAITSGAADLRLHNCTVSNNEGIGVDYSFYGSDVPVVDIQNVTIAQNGEVGLYYDTYYDNGELYLSHSILAQNGTWGFVNCEINGVGLYDHTYNLDNGITCDFDAGAGELPATWPALKPLAYYGGPTMTHKLEPDSPAIDAGSLICLDTDQRGVPRPQDGDGIGWAWCDMGAVEVYWSLFEDGFESGDTTSWSSAVP